MTSLSSGFPAASNLYCPILFRLAARLEQMTWGEFSSDPAWAALAIRNAQAASATDLALNWFDTWAECEALGAAIVRDDDGNPVSAEAPSSNIREPLAILKSELLPKLRDIAIRLGAERPPGTLVGGFVTGLSTMAGRLCATGAAQATQPWAVELAAQWAIELLRAYGEAGTDLFLIAEEAPDTAIFYREHGKILEPIFNLSRYYGRPLIVLSRPELSAEDRAATAAIGLQCTSQPYHLLQPRSPQPSAALRAIPEHLFLSSKDEWSTNLDEVAARLESKRALFISSWEVSAATEPERLLELGTRLKGPKPEQT